jgi:hypothetical protein
MTGKISPSGRNDNAEFALSTSAAIEMTTITYAVISQERSD